MKKFNTLSNAALLIFAATIIVCISSCKDDQVSGCSDVNALNYNSDADVDDGSCTYVRDKVIGDWEAVKFFFDEIDIIASGGFSTVAFEFEADGDFEWNGNESDGINYRGDGDWEVDGDFLEISFNSGSDTFCQDSEYRFVIDFDGDDELNLEDTCNNGTNLKIELDKS